MPFIQLEPDSAEELINVQVLAVTRLTRADLPGMLARFGSCPAVTGPLNASRYKS